MHLFRLRFSGLFLAKVLFLLSFKTQGQNGCQDPQAINYNPAALITDTSCRYSHLEVTPQVKIAAFPASLPESSALLLTDGRLFTLNDSGNSPDLFQMDTTNGTVLKKTRIANFPNVDWEELAADSQYVYIGDFGNNNGNRTNLRILRVRKAPLYHPDSLSVRAESIGFRYPDQTSFASNSTHNFDCEGFFYFNQHLHLFTKNRGNFKTTHYRIPATPGFHTAEKRDSLNVNGLITAASLRNDGKAVVLLGIGGNFSVFTWILFGFEGDSWFGGNRRRLDLPNLLFSGQAEGICFAGPHRIWIGNETFSTVPAGMRELDLVSYLIPYYATEAKSILPKDQGRFHFLTVGKRLFWSGIEEEPAEIQVLDLSGRTIFEGPTRRFTQEGRPAGLYQLQWKQGQSKKPARQPIRIF